MELTWRRPTLLERLASLPLILAVALALRVLAAGLVEWFVRRSGMARRCIFPDAEYYWLLARSIRMGAPYEIVEWGSIARKALRTPGYPMFLAACQTAFGEWPLAARLVQAVLGTANVWLVYRLTRRVVASSEPQPGTGRCWTLPAIAAALAALNPYQILTSALLLSEAWFISLMLLTLWGLGVLWRSADEPGLGPWRAGLVAVGTGAAGGAAILTKPSWGLFLPAALLAWVVASFVARDRRRPAVLGGAALVLAGSVLVMGPWWVRNARIYGRFVPTAVWLGASLYDGLNPGATGGSDMDFRDEPEFRTLNELDQDATLTHRALEFARSNPWRVLELAVIKLGRYWSPWPNAENYGSPVLAVAGAVVVVPLYLLVLAGAWDRRRDLRAWVLLAGPLLYFCAVHSVFVSSIRYRIPGELPAMALAAIGLRSIAGRVRTATRRV